MRRRVHRHVLRDVQAGKGHGREDEITYYQMVVPEDFPYTSNWNGPPTIGVVIRHSESVNVDTDDVRYYISSLPLGVKRFAQGVRGPWGIPV